MLEDFLHIPNLGKPRDMEELKSQIAIISEEMEKVEKMLQHVAVSNFNGGFGSNGMGQGELSKDLDHLMSQHIHLTSIKNQLHKKEQEFMSMGADNV